MYRKQVRRRRAVLALLVVGSFVLLTLTYNGSSGVQETVGTVLGPVESVADRALKPARDLVNWFDETFEARGRNEALREELQRERRRAVAGQVALAENAELRKLLELDRSEAIPSGYEEVGGRVIARNAVVWSAGVTIDVGSDDGVEVDDPVVSGDGLVGRVAEVSGGRAQVMLIADPDSAVTVKVVPAGGQGVLVPEVGDPDDLVLEFLDSNRRVGQGEAVVTAGWRDGERASLFPPNLPVGEVVKASIFEQEAVRRVHVRPYADLRELDQVQVLTGGSRG